MVSESSHFGLVVASFVLLRIRRKYKKTNECFIRGTATLLQTSVVFRVRKPSVGVSSSSSIRIYDCDRMPHTRVSLDLVRIVNGWKKKSLICLIKCVFYMPKETD